MKASYRRGVRGIGRLDAGDIGLGHCAGPPMAFRLTDCPARFAHILSPKSHCVIFDDKLQLGQMARELPSCWGRSTVASRGDGKTRRIRVVSTGVER